MIDFRASDPFPNLPLSQLSEKDTRAHSALVDRWLGLRINEVELKLNEYGSRALAPGRSGEHQRLWFGLDVQALLTPYIEIRSLLERVAPQRGQSVVDLGAAYGRLAFVLSRHFPGVDFIGYEYVGERVAEARRVFLSTGVARARIEHVDLAAKEFAPIAAEIYFVYDYGTPKALDKTLHDLRRIAQKQKITVIARGRHCRYLIETKHRWLANSAPAIAETRTTIYSSTFNAANEILTQNMH